MEKLEFKMYQEEKVHWRYEWPLKRTAKWLVHNLLARGQQHGLKRWLRHDENLSHKGKRYDKGLVDCLVSKVKGSMGLVNFQVGRRDIPNFHVGKKGEMSIVEVSHLEELTDEEEVEERPHLGDSHGTVNCVNEDDEKLRNSTIKE
jgi:hypothetical protein